jgi:AmmeMemoRadiSam system protein A
MYTKQQRDLLLEIAEQSIRFHLAGGGRMEPEPTDYEDELQKQRATFVTLHRKKELRGCIGTLVAFRPLVVDVAYNAYSAAFSDPRFPPLQIEEMDCLEIHISVLSPSEPMSFGSEQELVGQLQPGIDGLIIEEGRQRGTFLPSVWESLPEPTAFLTHLKLKAGLAADYWSDTIRISRYTTESFGHTLGK